MGCASSKKTRCKHCQRPSSPVRRSLSVYVEHPAQCRDDSCHLVTLTSSTLDSIDLENGSLHAKESIKLMDQELFLNGSKSEEKVMLQEKLAEAKLWSSTMTKKIPKLVPKTPTRTPPGEPETINAWELMEGLEDMSPLRSPNHVRSFSFDIVRSPPKPIWLQVEEKERDSEAMIPEFDPEIIALFRKSCQELPPDHPFYIKPRGGEKAEILEGIPNGVESKPEDLSGEDISRRESEVPAKSVSLPNPYHKNPSFSKSKAILYFTSLRGVRKTYEDCCHVRVILKGLGIRVDERDVSMHSGFKDELKELMGERIGCNRISLPHVFFGKKYIGGAEEIRRYNEDGELEKLFEGCESIGDNSGGYECEGCGDIRFVPCDTCSGSCKVYHECVEDEEFDTEEAEFGFQRCPDCNENGLVRCPACCDV